MALSRKQSIAIAICAIVLPTAGLISALELDIHLQAKREQAKAAETARKIAEKKAAEEARFEAMTSAQHLEAAAKALNSGQLGEAVRQSKAIPDGTDGLKAVKSRISELQAKQEAARIAQQKERSANKAAALLLSRKDFAKNLETLLLDRGLNVDVTTQGSKSEVLRIKWALTSKVAAHELRKGDIISSAKELGFKKVQLTNGFQSELGESWTWDLTK